VRLLERLERLAEILPLANLGIANLGDQQRIVTVLVTNPPLRTVTGRTLTLPWMDNVQIGNTRKCGDVTGLLAGI
jgi:hypothetical protein